MIRILVTGTQQCGKTSLVEAWTGLRGTPIGENTRTVFEAGARWDDRPILIRDIPAVDSLNNKFSLIEQVNQQSPDVVVLMCNYATYPLASALLYLVEHTTVPILVLLAKSDRERRLAERRDQARVELSSFNKDIASGRVDVQNLVVHPCNVMSADDMSEVYEPIKVREWILARMPVEASSQ